MFHFSSLASLFYYMIILPMNVWECIRRKNSAFHYFHITSSVSFSIKKYSRKHRLPSVYLIIVDLYHWKTHNLSRRPKCLTLTLLTCEYFWTTLLSAGREQTLMERMWEKSFLSFSVCASVLIIFRIWFRK